MMGGATPLIPDGLIMSIYDDYCSFYIEAIILMYVCVFYVYNSVLLMEATGDSATRYKTQWKLICPSLY